MHLLFQEDAELLHPVFDIDPLAQEGTADHGSDEEHGALGFQTAVSTGLQHARQGAGGTDEDDSEAQGLIQNFLKALLHAVFEKQACQTADDDRQNVGDSADASEHKTLPKNKLLKRMLTYSRRRDKRQGRRHLPGKQAESR